jgi:hypothetical protein
MNKQREEEKGVYPNGTAMFKTDTNPKALGFGEEEKEIERALAGGKMYQIREVKKLLDKALSSQLKEVLEVIEKELSVYEKVEEMSNDLVKAQIHGIRQVRDLVKSAIKTN